MSYRIAVSRVQVTLISRTGSRRRVDIFLRMPQTQAKQQESLGDRLNHPDTRFIPVEIENTVELYSLTNIAYIEVSGALPEVEDIVNLGGSREPATVVLMDGHALEGDFIYARPHNQSRVSDLLNLGDDFMLLYDGELSRYINRNAIARVRTGLDDLLHDA